MAELEKVIKEFEHLLNAARGNYQDFVDLTVEGGEEILELLKEHEAVKPTIDEYGNKRCGSCGRKLQSIFDQDLFCRKCGQEVKWDA